MADVVDVVSGIITDYDERTGEIIIRAKYDDFPTMLRREYKTCEVRLMDSRPLSAKQRRSCYAMIREISEWMGEIPEETKELLKIEFIRTELLDSMDVFSLSNAAMSVVASFQRWLARFILRYDVPTKKSLLSYVDDAEDYTYSCLVHKKCVICGKRADLHHVERIGMGANRDEVIHEGIKVLPLCREHHEETHRLPDSEFFMKYHLTDGIPADRTICKLYGLKRRKVSE